MSGALRQRFAPSLVVLLIAVSALVAVPSARAADPVSEVPPTNIRVCRSSGAVDVVSFERYVREVLPREFPPSWPMEVLKAGAIAVKSYAWYYINHPISSECDIGDSTRYQMYDPSYPYNRPNERSDAAVRATFQLRLEDASGNNLYAQYCSAGCSTHRQYAGEGRYLDQDLARSYAEQGWTYRELIAHFYRELSPRLTDWRAPFGLGEPGSDLTYGTGEAPLDVDVALAGVAPGDDRAYGVLFLRCTTDAGEGPHQLQRVPVTSVNDRAGLDFEPTEAADGCREHEATVHTHLYVKGRLVAASAAEAIRPWRSSSEREVMRLADRTEPVAAGIAVSRRMFEDRAVTQQRDGEVGTALLEADAAEKSPPGSASHAVVVRDDIFADALSATALAGTMGPILFTAGGPDGRLPPEVGDELDRILPPGATVHVVGGPNAVSEQTTDDIRQRGFDVRRHAGSDRTATAVAVASVVATQPQVPTVLVARGFPNSSTGWADAIAVGSWAAATGTPLLLTHTDTLSDAPRQWLAERDVDEAIVLGGPGAVSRAAAAAVPATRVTRVAGPSRDETASAIARSLWSRPEAPTLQAAMLLNIHDEPGWPHALAAAVYGARMGAPALAADAAIPIDSSGAWLDEHPSLPIWPVGSSAILPARIDVDASGQ